MRLYNFYALSIPRDSSKCTNHDGYTTFTLVTLWIPLISRATSRSWYFSTFSSYTSETTLCSLCGESTETVSHIVSGCRKLAQREYRKRHDKVALQVHWELYRKYGLECNDSGVTINPYQLQRIEKPDNLRYDYFTDKRMKHNRPDITDCSIQRHAGVDNYRHCCTSGLDENILTTESMLCMTEFDLKAYPTFHDQLYDQQTLPAVRNSV